MTIVYSEFSVVMKNIDEKGSNKALLRYVEETGDEECGELCLCQWIRRKKCVIRVAILDFVESLIVHEEAICRTTPHIVSQAEILTSRL